MVIGVSGKRDFPAHLKCTLNITPYISGKGPWGFREAVYSEMHDFERDCFEMRLTCGIGPVVAVGVPRR